jgi:dTDP-4-amino-4,6-dideoxygalactose transaminase
MDKYYTNISAEIYISAMLKILKEKGIIKDGEFEEAFAQSLQDYHEGKFVAVEIKDKR